MALGFECRIIGIVLADGLCDLGGGGSLQLKATMIEEGGPCPFLIIPWHLNGSVLFGKPYMGQAVGGLLDLMVLIG
jgi:hypothetical protein